MKFVSPVRSSWCTVSVSCLVICSFLATLSPSLVSLTASLPRVLSVYCLSAICLGFPLPHSSWFSFCFLVFRSSVLLSGGFVFLMLLLPGLFSPRCFGACLPSVLSPQFVWTVFSFSSCVGLVGSPSLSSLPLVSVVHLPLSVTPGRRFTFLLSRSSDSVKSPVPYSTGSSLWAESIPS